MNIKGILTAIGRKLKISDDGPMILKEGLLGEPYSLFCKSDLMKTVLLPYSTSMAPIICALSYVSFSLNQMSNPYRTSFNLRPLVNTIMRSYCESFNKLVKDELKKRRLDMFAQGSRYFHITNNFNPDLDAFVQPRVVMIQLLLPKHGSLDDNLTKVEGYMFKSRRHEALSPANIRYDLLPTLPIYKWMMLCNTNGVDVHLLRPNKNLLALRLEFPIPLIIPTAGLNKTTVENKFKEYLDKMTLGV